MKQSQKTLFNTQEHTYPLVNSKRKYLNRKKPLPQSCKKKIMTRMKKKIQMMTITTTVMMKVAKNMKINKILRLIITKNSQLIKPQRCLNSTNLYLYKAMRETLPLYLIQSSCHITNLAIN